MSFQRNQWCDGNTTNMDVWNFTTPSGNFHYEVKGGAFVAWCHEACSNDESGKDWVKIIPILWWLNGTWNLLNKRCRRRISNRVTVAQY